MTRFDTARRLLDDELGSLDLRLELATVLMSLLPPHVGSRLRVRLLRLAGFDLPRSTSIWGTPRLIGDRKKHERLHLGEGCWLNIDCHIELAATVHLGDAVALGQGVMILTNAHRIGGRERRGGVLEAKPVTVGAGVWLSTRSLILPGVTIGAGSIVAAGAVVASDVPPNVMVGGVPARVIKELGD